MSSSLIIELDTTSPVAVVYAPNETTTLTDTTYRVEANEKLANIQNFYFRDSRGLRHNVALQFFGTYYEGTVSFDNFSEGMATFYAQVSDEVFNQSTVVTHSVNIVETRPDHEIVVDIQDPREIVTTIIARKVISSFDLRTKIETDILND